MWSDGDWTRTDNEHKQNPVLLNRSVLSKQRGYVGTGNQTTFHGNKYLFTAKKQRTRITSVSANGGLESGKPFGATVEHFRPESGVKATTGDGAWEVPVRGMETPQSPCSYELFVIFFACKTHPCARRQDTGCKNKTLSPSVCHYRISLSLRRQRLTRVSDLAEGFRDKKICKLQL
jgi:hypothetical protein